MYVTLSYVVSIHSLLLTPVPLPPLATSEMLRAYVGLDEGGCYQN